MFLKSNKLIKSINLIKKAMKLDTSIWQYNADANYDIERQYSDGIKFFAHKTYTQLNLLSKTGEMRCTLIKETMFSLLIGIKLI